MKKIIFFNIILAFVISCNTKKENTEIAKINNDSITNIPMQTDSSNNKVKRDIRFNLMTTTKVTSEFERLDMDLFKRCMEESNANDLGNLYTRRLDSDIEIELDGRDRVSKDIINEITYQETHPDSYFSIYKIYDSRGYIKGKGLIITKAASILSRIGTWYFYDESGKLKNEINYDKHYQITFNDVLEFCKKERISVTKGTDYPKGKTLNANNEPIEIIYATTIDRGDEEYRGVKYWWRITFYNGIGTKRTDIFLDGQTGKVLSKYSSLIVP